MAINSSFPDFNFLMFCLMEEKGNFISKSFILSKVFITLPFCLLVLFLGHCHWRRRRSLPTTSHSDVFTYHAVVLELIFVLGVVLLVSGQHGGLMALTKVGMSISSPVFPGEMSFHLLTCVERHLAVVHPAAYRRLQRSAGVRIRNVGVGCVWLLCCGWIAVIELHSPHVPYIPYFCMLAFSLAVVSFCSVSVLCVLIRPRPGEVGGDKQRADQLKQRAFQTVTAIMAVLLVFFLGMLITFALAQSLPLSFLDQCAVLLFGNWCSLPSSLVLPLLYLHRAGKLPRCTGGRH